MLLTIALSMFAPDHVFGQDDHHATGGSAEAHRRHCHGEAASCSSASGGAGAALAAVPVTHGSPAVPLVATALAPLPGLLSGIDERVDDPPPRGT